MEVNNQGDLLMMFNQNLQGYRSFIDFPNLEGLV